jgi:drug/metabolite transporter (DMT)-like permease
MRNGPHASRLTATGPAPILGPVSAPPEGPVAATPAAGARPAGRAPQIVRAMVWMAVGGFMLCAMNGVMRIMTQQLDPLQSQFLRYVFGLLVMLPWVLRAGLRSYWPNNMIGQWARGVAHTAALALFFLALPHIPLADVTAIGFVTPIFVLVGAAIVLREKVSPARWLAAGVGFGGVLIVVAPHLSGHGAGWWSLVMLAASPLFAASFLINKALTRRDTPETIVFWQNVSVMLLTLPLALPGWRDPTLVQWGTFLLCGVLGTLAHLCMTRAFSLGDISAMQPVRFLDLIWAALLGIALFGDMPSASALLGGAVIVASTMWIARREAARR